MQKIFSLTTNDLRNIVREQILLAVFVFFPALLLAAGIWLVPALVEQFPEIEPYLAVIGAFLLVETVLGVGYVIASIFLDEKDQQLLPVLQVAPFSMDTFLLYRIFFGMLYLFGYSLLLINATDLVPVSPGQSVLVALVCSLPTALIILLLTAFAGNKVEGLAIFKGVNFVFLLPMVAFFVDERWKHAFGVIPTHWIYQFTDALANEGPIWVYFSVALGYTAILVGGLLWYVRKKVLQS